MSYDTESLAELDLMPNTESLVQQGLMPYDTETLAQPGLMSYDTESLAQPGLMSYDTESLAHANQASCHMIQNL